MEEHPTTAVPEDIPAPRAVRADFVHGAYRFVCPFCLRGGAVHDPGKYLCTCGRWLDVVKE